MKKTAPIKGVLRVQGRQGDVIIDTCDNIPEGLKPCEMVGNRFILAYGEATGHDHAVTVDDTDHMEMYEDSDGTLYLRVKKDVALKHQQHEGIVLKPGNYKARIQREFHPEGARSVVD